MGEETCSTCRFWFGKNNDDSSLCEAFRTTHLGGELAPTELAMFWASEAKIPGFVTRAEFGCRAYQPRKPLPVVAPPTT